MLTPQEVSEHAFAKASFGGYNMSMVDEFLDLLTADYTTLYKENATLKAKMKVLVDKLEEYRSTEDAMRKTLLTAQRMADELVGEAERKKAELMQSAEEEARARIGELRHEVDSEQLRLTTAQNATTVYMGKLKELHQHELDYLSSLAQLTAPAPRPADPVGATAQAIEATMERMMAQEPPPKPAAEQADGLDAAAVPHGAETEAAAPEADTSLYAELLELNKQELTALVDEAGEEKVECPTRRIDFDNLQFGKDYEIK